MSIKHIIAGAGLLAAAAAAATPSQAVGLGNPANGIYTCTHAALIVEAEGFRVIKRDDCGAPLYGFLAQRGKQLYYVTFDAKWGWIKAVRPIA